VTAVAKAAPFRSKREFRLDTEYRYNRSGPVRWIISHALRYPIFPVIAIVAAVLNNYAYSYIQLLVGRAFNLITSQGWATTALLTLALGVGVAALSQGITGLGRNYSFEFLAQGVERDARDELYVSLLGKSQTFHGRQRIGDIMARATNDVRFVNLLFAPALMLLLDSGMAIIVPLFVISQIDVRLLLVPLLFLVVLAITVWDYNRRLTPISQGLREVFGTMNAGLTEAVSGIDVVKANVREHYEWDKFTGNARRYRDLFIRQGEIQALYLPTLTFAVAWAAAFLYGASLWRAGEINAGQLISYIGLVGTLRFPTFMSIWIFNLVQMGVASSRRILETINTETELDENVGGYTAPIRGEVVFENVGFSYNGQADTQAAPESDGAGATDPPAERTVLKGISFRAAPGETIAIVGQTGSGKTTLTRLINRIFDVNTGRVLVDGVDVRDWSLEALRSQISTIEQDPFLFSRTLAENVAFGCADATQETIEEAAKAAQAHDFITSFREGYATEVGERGETLSGGQRQRIAIARAFLTDPRILILDDSTSAIDSATEDQIQRAMRRISSERTTFLITHRLSQIRWADRILVLRRGEIVDQGTHEELMARSADYRRIFARYD
jgi:ATP-binding cassette subfamily B protein